MPLPQSKAKAVGDGFITFVNTQSPIIALNLVNDLTGKGAGWFHGVPENASSSYPCNPYTQCPRLLLRYEEMSFIPMVGGGVQHQVEYQCSFFYYRRQIPGQSHQEILMNDLETIINCFTATPGLQVPTISGAIPGFNLWKCFPGKETIHPDLKHEFDDPCLRISVAQINFLVQGKIVQY